MTTIGFASAAPLDGLTKSVLKEAVREVYGDEPVSFTRGTDLGFGVPARVRTLSPAQISEFPNPQAYLTEALRRLSPLKDDPRDSSMLYLDIESGSIDDRWNVPREKYVRLMQYGWGQTGPIILTTDINEVMVQIANAEVVVAHNGHAFDLSVLCGDDALRLARSNRILDTMVHANMVFPAPYRYTNRLGHTFKEATKPEQALKWFGLDNLCYQIGLEGKEGDLKALAKEFGGYDKIPVDDPRYRAYATQDIVSLRQFTRALLSARPMTAYDWREQLNAAIDAQNSRNGFRVDISAATARRDMLSARKNVLLMALQEQYGLPTTGKMPWRSKVGKNAILRALEDVGITPMNRPTWPILKTGPSLGGKVMLEITEGTPAQEMGESLAEMMGQRPLAQLALDSTQDDGFVHPEITSLQRSGRKSTTKPGLTVWTSRGAGAVEKSYFIPDTPDHVLVAFDLSNADQRIVAALSGDEEYAKRFEPGVDGHEINARIMFGSDVYDVDPAYFRNAAKAPGHAWTYGAQSKKLALTTGLPIETTDKFVAGMAEKYTRLTDWQDEVRNDGSTGWLTNQWGRRMPVEPGRAFTQAPALMGQSGTREIMVDALIRMLEFDVNLIKSLKAQVHDELIFSFRKDEAALRVQQVVDLMGVTWGPVDGSGQKIEFPVAHGELASSWMEATH